jgi:carbonic anhydrase
MRISAIAALILGLSTLAAAQNSAPTAQPATAPWSYTGRTGPMFWGRLDPAYRACSQGRAQSPVDIRNARLNPALKPIQFHYIGGGVTVENNGHTIQIEVHPGSYMVADGVRYNLIQFHFHHPSEHAVKGRLSDLELHFVHRSADGKLAVVAVLFNEDMGAPNATLSTIWDHLPAKPGESEQIDDMVDPGGLLPTDRGYWTYTGSLTAPPCTEGVRWFVFQQPLTISRVQLRTFTALYKLNSRPLQDLHGRKIEADE